MERKAFLKSIIWGMAGIPLLNGFLKTFDSKHKKVIKMMSCYVAGYQFYEGEKIENNIRQNTQLGLKAEPENPYDPNAIAVYFKNQKLGFVPRSDNKIIANMIRQNIRVSARVNAINPESSAWERVLVEVGMEV